MAKKLSEQSFSPQETILRLLAKAGAEGVPKSRLKVSSSPSGRQYRSALVRLEKERQVGNLGTVRKSRYVLAVYFNPLERAYNLVLRHCAGSGRSPIPLFTAKQLQATLPAGFVGREGAAAVRLLVQEGQLVAVKSGRGLYYFARRLLPPWPDCLPPQVISKTLDREQLLAAYQQLVQETQFPDVRVAALHARLGAPPLDDLHRLLLDACRNSQAVPSRGDLSLASAAEKKAALHIDGVLYLMIRFIPPSRPQKESVP